MTRAEESYRAWWKHRNGMASTAHSFGEIPYVAGYEAAEDDLRARLTSAVKTAMDRDVSMQKVIDLIREI